MADHDEPLIARWSRRKAEAKRAAAAPDPVDVKEKSDHERPGEQDGDAAATLASPGGKAATANATPSFADFDFEALDAKSDYTRFMDKSVPADVRSKALRKLWDSDPMLSLHDGLDDCCGDYTDARWAVGEISTIYRVGKGFLTDEEIAKWEQLGRPEPEAAEAGQPAAPVLADAEPVDAEKVDAEKAADESVAVAAADVTTPESDAEADAAATTGIDAGADPAAGATEPRVAAGALEDAPKARRTDRTI